MIINIMKKFEKMKKFIEIEWENSESWLFFRKI